VQFHFHHVGQQGSAEDFTRTVFGEVDLARIAAALRAKAEERQGPSHGRRPLPLSASPEPTWFGYHPSELGNLGPARESRCWHRVTRKINGQVG
jgi:hypothetical protein